MKEAVQTTIIEIVILDDNTDDESSDMGIENEDHDKNINITTIKIAKWEEGNESNNALSQHAMKI